jgi:16S rRNA (adenine1518-N6/adenine1519-N6)-dimethyltransferase
MKLIKARDQYILSSRTVLRKIIDSSELSESDVVLEVGCGTGNLTAELLKNAGKVIGIEKDGRLVGLLRGKFSREIEDGKLELIEGDALRVEFPEFDKFVSNIPYSISSPLTFRVLRSGFQLAVVMYQKEFAERMIARPGTKKYGRLTVALKPLCRVEIVDFVSRWAFKPVPKVDSAITKLIPEPEIRVKNFEIFDDLLKVSFSMRRKKFEKAIKRWLMERDIKVEISEIVPHSYILNKRADQIEPEHYAEIANRVYDLMREDEIRAENKKEQIDWSS